MTQYKKKILSFTLFLLLTTLSPLWASELRNNEVSAKEDNQASLLQSQKPPFGNGSPNLAAVQYHSSQIKPLQPYTTPAMDRQPGVRKNITRMGVRSLNWFYDHKRIIGATIAIASIGYVAIKAKPNNIPLIQSGVEGMKNETPYVANTAQEIINKHEKTQQKNTSVGVTWDDPNEPFRFGAHLAMDLGALAVVAPALGPFSLVLGAAIAAEQILIGKTITDNTKKSRES